MNLAPPLWSKLCLCIVGDDLHAAQVVRTPLGVRVDGQIVIERFLATPAAEARRALSELLRSRQRVTLVLPPEWCAVRPMQLSRADWAGARDEVRRSLDRLLPIPADDAMLGYIELETGSDDRRGVLIATRRSRVRPWTDAIQSAVGRPVGEIVSAHMAMLGLGLQEAPEANIAEGAPQAGGSRHRLRFGKPVAVDEPEGGDEAPPDIRLPGQAEGSISGGDLAVAAGLAPLVATDVYAPLQGRPPRRIWKWAPVAAGMAAALALIATAGTAGDARLRAAAEHLRAEQQSLTTDFEAAQALRSETRRLHRLLEEGVAEATAEWRSTLPALAEMQRAMPEDGFFYRLDVTPGGVAFSGEAPNAPGVLQRLEDSPLFTAAQRSAPITPSSVSGMDVFELRAERAPEGATP